MNTRNLLALMFAMPLLCAAQTIHSIADGEWHNTATWDCGCVPDTTANVIIDHHVTWDPNTYHYIHTASTTISPNGLLDVSSMQFGCKLNVKGVLHDVGNTNLTFGVDSLIVSGSMLVGEDFDLVPLQIMLVTATGHVSIMDSFYNLGGTTTGAGSICVADSTWNTGTINGTLDICDLTPSGLNPPLDVNTGTVAPTVTFCTGTTCIAGIAPHDALAQVGAYPNPAHGSFTLTGVPSSLRSIELIDALGQVTQRAVASGGTVDINGLASGCYTAVLRSAGTVRAMKVMVE